MKTFLQKFGQYVVGVLSGFDRLVLRGHIRQLAYLDGMNCYMALNRIRDVDFKQHVKRQQHQDARQGLRSRCGRLVGAPTGNHDHQPCGIQSLPDGRGTQRAPQRVAALAQGRGGSAPFGRSLSSFQ